jgi:transposase
LIRSSKHTTKFSNKGKLDNLNVFINEYRRVAAIIIDEIYSYGYKWFYNNELHEFNIQKNLLELPKYIEYKNFSIETFLTARALSSLCTQLTGVLKASTEKQRKRIYMLEKMKANTSKRERKLLAKKLKQNIPQKPDTNNLNPELPSTCCKFIESDKYFNGFIKLSSVTKNKVNILIPIKYTKHSNKFKNQDFQRMNSFLISETFIDIRWKNENVVQKQEGIIVGADQGLKDILTLSNKSTTPKTDVHGHSLESIIDKLSRKQKGSKAFKRAQEHRKNFINWSINQLDFDNIKQINLEKIWNINYKSNTSRKLRHWTNTTIVDKIESRCIGEGVLLQHQNSSYRSQRCSGCGIVLKQNRKGKEYTCSKCGLVIDSDYNAALNHEIELPEIPYSFRNLNLNRKGFYWLKTGIFDLDGRSLESLLVKN